MSKVKKDLRLLTTAYKQMLMIRRFEEKAGQLYGMGKIGGFCHLCIGQEAVAVGVQMALDKDDAVITSYRDHGQMLACGSDPKVVMAELLGRKDGCSKGKGGSMHMFDLKRNFYGGHGIVAAQVSLGTGIAFSFKYRKQNNICVAYFGDGAVNQGQVYESFNMAKLWNLPILYIIENNEYAMGTSVRRSSSEVDLYKRGVSFNIEGKRVDGLDVIAVYDEVKTAVNSIKNGNGPMLLEMKTYRFRGHSMSDPASYRTKEELNKFKQEHDCIENLKAYLRQNKISDETIEKIEDEVSDIIKSTIEFALNSSEPEEQELYTNVYV